MRAKGNETRAFKVELEKISYGSGVVWPRAQARLGAAYFVWLGWGAHRVGGRGRGRGRGEDVDLDVGGCGGRGPPERFLPPTRRTTRTARLLSQAWLPLPVSLCASL
jgi:hypothetical protein